MAETRQRGRGAPSDDRERERRALRIFKEVIDLPVAERSAAVDDLAAGDAAVVATVGELLAQDARADALVAGQGQELLAADMMRSMLGRGEAPGLDEPLPEHIGPYRVLRVLGRGGMGVVYEAEQETPRRRVAIKTVHPWLRSPALAERFAFEVQALASLRHRAIPRLYEVREELGATWMVMELVHGVPIARWKEGRPLTERLELLIEVLDAVHDAHLAGIAHRDLKPANVLVDDGHPRVLDFGLAAPLDAPGLEPRDDPASSGLAGTLAYMAPEQLEPGAVPDARADTYALGVLCHEVLTGELPFPLPDGAPSIAALREAKRGAGPPRAAALVPELRDDVDHVLARAMATDPDARYPTVAAFADDLRRYLRDRPISARPATLTYRLALAARRHRGLVRAVAATLLLVGLVASVVTLVQGLEADARRALAEERAEERLSALDARQAELLARGEVDAADAQFELFARMRENVGTRALYEGWLRRAARQRDLGRTEHEVRAYGGAYAAALDETGKREALRALGEAFLAAGRWSGLEQVVRRLDELGAGDAPAARRLALAVHAYRRDAAGVAPRADASPAGRVVSELLGSSQPLEMVATSAFPVPEGREDGARLVVMDQRSRIFGAFSGGARARRVATVALPEDVVFGGAFPRPPGPGLDVVLARTATGGRWFPWDRPEETVGSVAMPTIHTTAARVVDGRFEAVVGTAGTDRRLGVIPALAADAAPRWAPPEVVGPPSDADALLFADLDGDGEDELIAALGAWSTYDLRVFRVAPDGALSLLARRRVGAVAQLAIVPRLDGPPLLAVAKGQIYASPTLLGPEHPFGLPSGIHLFALEGGELAHLAHLPFHASVPAEVGAHALVVGDFDGDGLQDLVVGTAVEDAEVAVVLRQVTPLTFDAALLGGVDPQAALDLDGDGDDELIVRLPDDGDRGWVLGLGGAVPPALPAPPRRDVPTELDADDPAVARAWRSALELAAMGLGRAAAEELEALSRLTISAATRSRLTGQAAELWRANGEADLAARRFEEALALASDPADRDRLELGAARSWLAAHDVARAYPRFAALRSAPGALGDEVRTTLSWLEPMMALGEPLIDVIVGGRLHPALALRIPEALARDRSGDGAVWVDGFSDAGVIAELPVHYAGGRVGLTVALDVTHQEIGAGLTVALVADEGDETMFELDVMAIGGGLAIRRSAHCGPWDERADPTWLHPVPSASTPASIRLDLDHIPGPDDTRCVIVDEAAGEERVDRRYRSRAVAPGDYRVEIRAMATPSWDAVMWARFRLRELTVRGLTVRERPLGTRDRASRALYEGRLEEAAAGYAVAGEPLDRLLVALARGDAATAEGLTEEIGEGWARTGDRAGRLIRARPEEVAPLVLGALGHERFARAYRRAWDVARRYVDTVETQRGLLVPALDALTGRGEDELALIASRVRLHLRGGDGEAALTLAETALAEAAAVAVTEGELPALVTELELLAAAAARMVGDGGGARRHLERWLARAPSREAALETLRNQPDFAPLEGLLGD